MVFLDSQDVFSREPLSSRFLSRYTGETFALGDTLGDIHVLYGDSVSNRLSEINALEDYWG